MIRNWTLVSAFATLALVSWAQPQGASRPGTPPDAVRTIERGAPPQNEAPPGLDPRQQRDLRQERQQRENPSPANPELVNPRTAAPGAPDADAGDRARGRQRPEAVSGRPTDSAPARPAAPAPEREATPRSPATEARIQEHQQRIREQLENRGSRPVRPGADAAATPEPEASTPPVTLDRDAPRPRRETPAPDVTPRATTTPAGEDASSPRRTPRGTPARKALPEGTARPKDTDAETPASRATPRARVSPAAADATPFVPSDMPDRLRDRRATPAASDETPKAADAPVTPATGESAAPSESTQPSEENAPREPRRPTAPPASATPPASTTPPSASPSPGATDTPTPTGTPGRAETPAPQASPSPAAGTPAAERPAGRPDRPVPSSSPTPSASPSTPTAPGEPSATPGPAAPPSTDAGKKALEERRKRPAVPVSEVKTDELNQAAAALLGKKPEGTPPTSPAEVKLTPWIAPEVVTDPSKAEQISPDGDKPVLVMPPPGATPTPTPAPERITVDPTTIINNVQNITIAPTPPPAPTPGATPVATPPGVTPVPNNFRPDRGWVPYPGWRPPSNWQPPHGWTPPGGWSPPPGWKAPSEWEVRLRRWGWSYIPRRGWVVPVQWTPPPDFVVPPDWYYMPSYAYDDYGLYDPSEVVVMAGHARPDLQVNININEVYMPPAPPPVQVLEAPPPPPRPAPPEPPRLPEQITNVEVVAEVLSRPRNPNGPRYQGPVLVTESVHFDFDSYAIKPESFPTLDAVGQALVSEMPDAILNVEGHTDSDGSDEYNQRLSEQRAWSVKSYLVQKFGLDPNRLIIVGYGERAPIASNATEQGKARNRRVEFENVTDLYKAQVVETAQP